MDDAVPWSRRTGRVLASGGTRIRSAVTSAWDWYTGFGQGTWLMTVALLVVAGIVIAVVAGRHPTTSACDEAAPIIQYVESARTRTGPLDAGSTATLHIDAVKLQAIARQSCGGTAAGLRKVATVAAAAQTGRRFDPALALASYHSSCDFSR